MIPQFPHYRVVARQKNIPQEYSLFLFSFALLFLGLFLGFLFGKCCFHHK